MLAGVVKSYLVLLLNGHLFGALKLRLLSEHPQNYSEAYQQEMFPTGGVYELTLLHTSVPFQ